MLNLLGPAPSQHLLSNDDVDALQRAIGPASIVERRRDICSTGSEYIHLLVDGWAAKYKLVDGGRRQLATIHLSGEVCDLDRLFYPDLTYSVCALSDCRIVPIAIGDFRRLVDERAAIRNLFWSLMGFENVALVEQVTNLGSRSARERVARFLCELIQRLEPRGDMHDRSFRLELTQAELADCLGVSLVHINRTLRSLVEEKIILSRGSRYTILDLARLKAIAGGGQEASDNAAWRSYEASNVLRTSVKDQHGLSA